MKRIILLLLIPFVFALISCEPIRITTKVAPFEVEPQKETPTIKKLPNEAVILIDDSKVYSATKYSADVIHTVEFPAGNLLRQVLPIYFDAMFTKTSYGKNLSHLMPENSLLIMASVENINFDEDCCVPLVLTVNARTQFIIYDNDLLEIALPVSASGSGKTSKPGLFASMNEKDYGTTAYQALYNSVKVATDAIYEAVKNPKAQISEAKQLINKDPNNLFAYRIVANLSLKNNDIAEALAASQMHVQLAPKETYGYLLLYKCYLAQSKYKEALIQLEQAVSLAPENGMLLVKLYDFYVEIGKYEKAVEAVKRYIEQRPDDQYAPLRLATLYFKLGKYDEVIRLSEKTVGNLSFSGIGAAVSKNEEKYVKINSVKPNSPAQKAELKPGYEITEIDGKSTLNMKLNEVIQKLRGEEKTEIKLTIKKPDSDETFTKTLMREKFYTTPVAASYMALMVLSYLEVNDIANARKYMEEAEKISSEDRFLKLAKAALYLKEGKYEKALNEASSVKDSDYAQILQAIAHAKLGKYEESLKVYKRISKSKNLLITNKAKNELFIAFSPYLEKIENIAFEDEKAGQYGAALRQYAYLVQFLEPEKSEKIRSRVARIISKNPSLIELKDEARKHFLQAEVLFTKDKFEEAIKELDRASEIQPFNPQIYFNKAIIYEKISDYAKAIENMEVYLQLNPHAPNAQIIRDQIYKWRFMLEKEI